MRSPAPSVGFFVLALAMVACSRSISTDDALQAVRRHALFKPADRISVDAVSHQAGSTEAIAKTSINGNTYNLKLRRYDTGWTWEFAETKGGTWVSPDVMMTGLREEERATRVQKWVKEEGARYAEAARLLDHFSHDLPRRPDHPFSEEMWDVIRRVAEKYMRAEKDPNEYQKLSIRLIDDRRDPWGTEMILRLDAAKRTGYFASAGPDKKLGTKDDLICVRTGRKEWDGEHEKVLWNYYRTWIAPEGLNGLLADYVDPSHGENIETQRAVE